MPDDSTQRFSQRAQNYARFRPGYPDSLVETLERAIGLAAGWVVADIGSGTGISSELFLKCGCTVFSVEPNDDMRRAAEGLLAGYNRFHSIAARAEATTLTSESVNLVVAGQAFHWFDATRARSEFRRILRHERFVALFWNNRKSHASPFQHDYERLVQKYSSECRMAGNQRIMHTHSVLEPFFEADLIIECFPMSKLWTLRV